MFSINWPPFNHIRDAMLSHKYKIYNKAFYDDDYKLLKKCPQQPDIIDSALRVVVRKNFTE